jgi:hypothetical protein
MDGDVDQLPDGPVADNPQTRPAPPHRSARARLFLVDHDGRKSCRESVLGHDRLSSRHRVCTHLPKTRL